MSDIRSASDQRYIYFPHLDFFTVILILYFLLIHSWKHGHVSDCPISFFIVGVA